jgi:hypothetical protein
MARKKFEYRPRPEVLLLSSIAEYMDQEGFLLDRTEATSIKLGLEKINRPIPDWIQKAISPDKGRRGRPRDRWKMRDYREITDARDIYDYLIRALGKARRKDPYGAAMGFVCRNFRMVGRKVGKKRWEQIFRQSRKIEEGQEW